MKFAGFESDEEDSPKSSAGGNYFGKYRGKVIDNKDPLYKGRIRAIVSSVTSFMPTTWVEPAAPYAGLGVGLFVVPPINANVWVEYIEGDPRYPVYTGFYWDEKDLAIIPPQTKPFVKFNQVQIRTNTTSAIIEDDPIPNIKIETIDGHKIVINSSGIQLGFGPPTTNNISFGIKIDKAGNISLSGNKVSIEATASINIKTASLDMKGAQSKIN